MESVGESAVSGALNGVSERVTVQSVESVGVSEMVQSVESDEIWPTSQVDPVPGVHQLLVDQPVRGRGGKERAMVQVHRPLT